MRIPAPPLKLKREAVVRLWLARQGHLKGRGRRLTRADFVALLANTGGLQLDSVNVLDRAHYLTLWSRFGAYDRRKLDAWVYGERLAYDFLAHQACLVPPSRLPLIRRYALDFDPQNRWWQDRKAGLALRRHVLARIRAEGGLESAQFQNESPIAGGWFTWKGEKMALEWLLRRGRLAIGERKSFRRVYDLADRVYEPGQRRAGGITRTIGS